MTFRILPLFLLAVRGAVIAAEVDYPLDASGPDGRRPGGTLTQNAPAPPLADDENKDLKRERNYPDQPPTIPHSIRGYQIDKNGNKWRLSHRVATSATSAMCRKKMCCRWWATASRPSTKSCKTTPTPRRNLEEST